MAKPIRKLFTDDEILWALNKNKTITKAARKLSKLRGVHVGSQLLTYWKKQLESKTATGKPAKSPAIANKAIREEMELRQADPDDYARRYKSKEDNSRILIIPDQHAPYQHPDAIPFLIDVAAQIKPTRVVNLGDETDGHALSMHDSDPNLDSAGPELAKARKFIQQLAKVFPVMDICHSNHGSLVFRRANKFGIPLEYIKSYRDVLFPTGGGDGWEWKDKVTVRLPNGDKTIFQHQSSGDIIANAAHERANIIQGHEHGVFNLQYRGSSDVLYWAMTSGCLIDKDSLAFAYGKLFPKKPLIGCSAIIDSQPILIPMPQDDYGRYTGKLGGVYAD